MPLYQLLPTGAASRMFKGAEAVPVFCLFCLGLFRMLGAGGGGH